MIHQFKSIHFASFRSKFPYHPITAIPSNAATILNVIATMPLAVNPSGNGAGGAFWPRRSRRSSYLKVNTMSQKTYLSSIIIIHHQRAHKRNFQMMQFEKKVRVCKVEGGKKGGQDLLTWFPAALPAMEMSCFVQASMWEVGMARAEALGEAYGEPASERVFWRSRGRSTMVAMRPEATCHSMWQWKSQMPGL